LEEVSILSFKFIPNEVEIAKTSPFTFYVIDLNEKLPGFMQAFICFLENSLLSILNEMIRFINVQLCQSEKTYSLASKTFEFLEITFSFEEIVFCKHDVFLGMSVIR
jgi:hypothetical protein